MTAHAPAPTPSPDLQTPPHSFITVALAILMFSDFHQTVRFYCLFPEFAGLTLQEQEVSKHSSVLVRNRPLEACTKHGRPLLVTEVLTRTPSLGK